MKNYNKSILNKLIIISKESRGYFIPGLIYDCEGERGYLKNFITRHPFFFDIAFKNKESRTPIYQINNVFNEYYKVKRNYSTSNNILINIAWISFFLGKKNEIIRHENITFYKNRIYIIDDFKDNIPRNISDAIIITVPQRKLFLDGFSLNYTIAPYFFRKWVHFTISNYMNQECNFSADQPLNLAGYDHNSVHNFHMSN